MGVMCDSVTVLSSESAHGHSQLEQKKKELSGRGLENKVRLAKAVTC